MKVCPYCKKEKEDEEFGYFVKMGKTYLKAYCKECQRERNRKYRETHKRKYVYRYNKYEGLE